MKIVWSLFIHRFVHFTHEYHALETCWHMDKVQTYEWMNVIQILHFFINLCVKCVFNARNVQIMKWMNFAKISLLGHEILSLWWWGVMVHGKHVDGKGGYESKMRQVGETCAFSRDAHLCLKTCARYTSKPTSSFISYQWINIWRN
jgi:hypothetical protein